MSELLTSIMLSIGQYVREKGVHFVLDHLKGKRAFDDKKLHAYLEWCRRKDQSELVQEVTDARAEIERQLRELDLDVEDVAAKASAALEGDFVDLKSKLANLQAVVSPYAFSPWPLGFRSNRGIPFLGREEDSALLCKAEGDLILTGQPGVGKTALLHQHVSELGAEFLVTENADTVRATLKVSYPRCIIVDDAGDKLSLIRTLLHARQESGAPFRLIAVCWPYETEQLRQCLRIGRAGVVELGLLPARVVATLVQEVARRDSKEFSPALLVEIRQQAAGRPGLAIRLAELVLEEGVEILAEAGAHVDLVDRAFSRVAEQGQIRSVLAAFAVGGERGLRKEDVSEVLRLSLPTMMEQLKALRDGGVLDTHSDGTIATIPSSLRHSLIKLQWLTGDAMALDSTYWQLFERAGERYSALKTLIGSVRIGSIVQNRQRLLDELRRIGSPELWRRYACLGEDHCEEALTQCPDATASLSDPGLHYLPPRTIRMLLEAAVGDDRPEHSHPESPVRKLSDWVVEPARAGRSRRERRELLFDTTIRWAKEGGDIATCWRILPKCVSLRVASGTLDPVDDRRFILQHGVVPEDELPAVSALWDRIVAFAHVHPPESWAPLLGAFHDWLYPGSMVPDVSLPESFREYARKKAEKVLPELASVPGCPRNALARWVRERADVLAGLAQRLAPNKEFVTVFPSDPTRTSGDLQSQFEERVGLAQALGSAWAAEKPEEVAARLDGFAHEVRTLGSRVWPDLRSAACAALASSVDDIKPWVELSMAASLDVECVAPLLEHAARTGHQGAASWLVAALSHPPYQFHAAETILAHGDLPSCTMDAIVEALSRRPDLVRTQALRGEIDTRWFPRLAAHPSADVLRSLVLGDFESEAKPFLNADRNRWLDVFRRGVAGLEELHPNEFYHLDQVLGQFPELAVDIVTALLRNAKYLLCGHNPYYAKLVAVLSAEDRMRLLPLLQDLAPGEFTLLLVGNDVTVYEALLQRPELKRHHLCPLMGRPFDEPWRIRARMATSHGYSPEDVASAPFSSSWSFSGSAVAFWEEWRREFEELVALQDELLTRIGKAGVERCGFQSGRASQEERHEEIYGISGDE